LTLTAGHPTPSASWTEILPGDGARRCKPKKNHFPFPYLLDESQEVAKKFGAVCTPDFFGYNNKGQLQYRGRIRKLNHLTPFMKGESELLSAMKLIASNGQGPKKQFASMGCSIKWK
jgi:hypothetical protein